MDKHVFEESIIALRKYLRNNKEQILKELEQMREKSNQNNIKNKLSDYGINGDDNAQEYLNSETAVQWLVDNAEDFFGGLLAPSIIEQAKQMEKEQQRKKMIDLLEWMNKVATNNPMAFETDNDDIVDMFLNGYYNSKSE